ncbi:hydroxymethylglutaryl-CoA synthase family protein [Flavobacterium sp. FlaQc-52]|jgi:polyketide biosynthesis 3-hydroxy-3-methylglutaryl-CoA synthase-like enzyme PksG|uniref:Hydroxymethylglutaryl-CoA synthase family protein n=1 Tax=Flavobacterium cupriresistens TaxID=2893885 RepID=A0ABU4RH72_9FLAO|nr:MULTISPECIES: hydroxymethylglutaryl-CoA synthase family protein [unclassified Flavobacterium]MDX6191621.1 hydroxymethylglutaryl-CoA synthase family protein [Flavobacterium sp. Fl-318]
MRAGIEAINIYCGSAVIDVAELAKHRQLNTERFENLLMKEKTVPMPYEDPISNGVNAAKPLLDALTDEEIESIDMLITCSESGIDFGKSMSTYIHDYLKLSRNCRLFELKNACYSGTAGLQMAINFILSGTAVGRKVLVIATDIMRMSTVEGGAMEMSFVEPSSGSGAVAMLISDQPKIFEIDKGASGYYGYEVMDTCRPVADKEAGDSDLSLLSYLDCCENSFKEYQKRVDDTDYQDSFQYLVFHTPFGGMVKGAHRTNMRKFKKAKPDQIEEDFQGRVAPSLEYCQRVGNIMGATTYLALVSMIEKGNFETPKRVGIFSYGSGCCSEFFSGVIHPQSQMLISPLAIEEHLDERVVLSMEEYESTFAVNSQIKFGTRDYKIDTTLYPEPFSKVKGKKKLIFSEIKNYHRIYEWV